jgi:hypothetical protein
MYILDTDHLSVLERKGANSQPLLQRTMLIIQKTRSRAYVYARLLVFIKLADGFEPPTG